MADRKINDIKKGGSRRLLLFNTEILAFLRGKGCKGVKVKG